MICHYLGLLLFSKSIKYACVKAFYILKAFKFGPWIIFAGLSQLCQRLCTCLSEVIITLILSQSLKKLAQISIVSVAFNWTLSNKYTQTIGDGFKLVLLIKILIIVSTLCSVILLVQIGDELRKNLRNVRREVLFQLQAESMKRVEKVLSRWVSLNQLCVENVYHWLN